MKVVKRNVVKVNNLKDYFVKELTTEPTMVDVVKEQTIDGNLFRIYCDVVNDGIDLVVSVWNEQTGVDLGIREYFIPLFNDIEKERIKLPNDAIGLAILECLNNYGVSFNQLGDGYISEWIMNDNETQMTKLWFSNDFTYISLTHKQLEPIEQTISKETLLDSLGL